MTKLFHVGETHVCCDGSIFTVLSTSGDTFLGSDGYHRYDRDHELERGRITGTHSWPPHPKTVAEFHPLTHPKEVVKALASCPDFGHQSVHISGETVYNSQKLMRQVCENLDKIIHYKKTGKIL